MKFGNWDTLFNVLLLLFWHRLWCSSDRDTFFNPYLGSIQRSVDTMISFLRPVCFGMTSRMISGAALLFLLILRAMLVPQKAGGMLQFGFEKVEPYCTSAASCLSMSVLSFALFLFNLWAVCLLYVRAESRSVYGHAAVALDRLSRPFSEWPLRSRPIVLILYGTALAVLLNLTGWSPAAGPGDAAAPGLVLRAIVSAAAGIVNVLPLVQSFMILLIIGSWVSMATGHGGILAFCREWTDVLLGPFRRIPLQIGAFDLAPIVFILAVGLVHSALTVGLLVAYKAV